MLKKIYNHFMTDPLYQNSIFTMASTFVMAVFGFAFWIVVAHISPVENIGIATALISLMTLISSFTHLGLNVGLIRYLPKSTKRNDTITSSVILVAITTIVVTIIFLTLLQFVSPRLLFLRSNQVYIISFIIFMTGSVLNFIMEGIFMAYRAAYNTLIKNTVLSLLKLLLPFILIFFGAYGIFSSIAIATVIAVLVSFGILIYKYNYRPAFVFNTGVLKEMAVFSGGNYIAGFLFQAATLVLPLLIVNFLHAKVAAYYYIDTMILSLLTIIPQAATDALLAEGSHDVSQLKGHVKKAISIIALLLIPAITVIFFFGNIILHFFGKTFEIEAFRFLQIISISAIFMSVTYLGNALLRIRHQILALIIMNLLGSILVLGFSYLFITRGLTGIGWGWLLGQALLAVLYLFYFGKDKFLK